MKTVFLILFALLSVQARIIVDDNISIDNNTNENSGENGINGIVDNAIENIDDNVIENNDDNAIENIDDNAIENIVDNAIENIDDNAIENIDDNAIENNDENAIENNDENAIENIDDNAIENIDENAIENIDENVIDDTEEIKPIMFSDEDISEEILTEEEKERRFGIPLQPCADYSEVVIPLHISHPSTCGRFYKCYNGRAYLMDCPASEHWSVHLDRCDYAPLAKCKLDGNYQYKKRSVKPAQANTIANADKTNEFSSTTYEEVIDPRCNGGDPFKPLHFQHLADCSKFYKCYLGKAYVIKCPKGQQWASRLNRCDFPSVAKCSVKLQPVAASLNIPKVPECPGNGEPAHFAIEGHPTKFFSCIEKQVFVMECSKGEFYHANLDRCFSGEAPAQPDSPMFPNWVPQFPNSIEPQEIMPETKDDNVPLKNNDTFNFNSGHFDSHCPSQDDPMNPTLLKNPTDCKRFFKCFAGKAFDIACPVNQEYSSINKRCDYKVFAQCTL